MITLASRCQGNCRHQLSQCSGKRRVNQITPGTIASHVIPLDNSQTAGSHAATSRSDRRTSMNMVMALATPLTMVTRTQKPTSRVRRQRSGKVWDGDTCIPTFYGAAGHGNTRLAPPGRHGRSDEHTSELQSLMRISYAVF